MRPRDVGGMHPNPGAVAAFAHLPGEALNTACARPEFRLGEGTDMASRAGSIVHVELHSADPAKSKRFYGDVFGWKFEEIPAMNYTTWRASNEPGGGIMQTMEGRQPQVLNYIMAESVDETLREILEAGGLVLQPKMEIPGQGWWALFQEPGGTMMAIYEGNVQARPRPATRKAKAKKAAKKGGKKAGKRRR